MTWPIGSLKFIVFAALSFTLAPAESVGKLLRSKSRPLTKVSSAVLPRLSSAQQQYMSVLSFGSLPCHSNPHVSLRPCVSGDPVFVTDFATPDDNNSFFTSW